MPGGLVASGSVAVRAQRAALVARVLAPGVPGGLRSREQVVGAGKQLAGAMAAIFFPRRLAMAA